MCVIPEKDDQRVVMMVNGIISRIPRSVEHRLLMYSNPKPIFCSMKHVINLPCLPPKLFGYLLLHYRSYDYYDHYYYY
jgi:hypothetical protein